MDTFFKYLIGNLIVIFLYLFFPTLYYMIKKKPFTKRFALFFVIINGVLITIGIYIIISIKSGEYFFDNNFLPAVIWSSVAYYMLKRKTSTLSADEDRKKFKVRREVNKEFYGYSTLDLYYLITKHNDDTLKQKIQDEICDRIYTKYALEEVDTLSDENEKNELLNIIDTFMQIEYKPKNKVRG